MTKSHIRILIVFCFSTVLFLFSVSTSSAKSSFEVERECDKEITILGRDEAIRHWTEPAKNGDAKAQFCLGLAMRPPGAWICCKPDEKQIAKDAKVAIEWIRRAAEQGLSPAQVFLANAYASGLTRDGVSQDLEQARVWMEKAANQGNPQAHVELAVWYRDGDKALPLDIPRAYRHLRLAVELFRMQEDPSEFRNMMGFFGFEEEVKRLAGELTFEERTKADSWIESQLHQFPKP